MFHIPRINWLRVYLLKKKCGLAQFKLVLIIYICVDVSKKATATHSSTLAWKISWMEEPSGLQSMGSWRVRHNWATSLSLFTFMHWRRKWQPPCSCLDNPRASGDWWTAVYRVTRSWTRPTWLSSSSTVMCTYTHILRCISSHKRCVKYIQTERTIHYLGFKGMKL